MGTGSQLTRCCPRTLVTVAIGCFEIENIDQQPITVDAQRFREAERADGTGARADRGVSAPTAHRPGPRRPPRSLLDRHLCGTVEVNQH